jgi:hypothetical protein|tara:strand:+ start:6462 stop:9929 length:3468 start_codon:yes stop_codon:yes gene_type:complete
MNIRLVAYRKATNAATSDSAYNLDLQETPSISLNFQFSDVKEPEKRKGNYSQTFKLPFTDNNNAFFQNWFNVNLETLVFSTRTKFDAVLFVGSVPQFEGSIQLKAVYQKAQVYEIVLMSNTSDLFSVIGNNKLKDVFLNDDGSYSDELNHTLIYENMVLSWNGSTSTFVNTQAPPVSLQDADSQVQKVMYPLSVTKPKFYYDIDTNRYLNMSNPAAYSNDLQTQYMADVTQFSPSVQIKELFKLIIARAGFSYTSTFIDGNYFGNLFMTTCNHISIPVIPTTSTGGELNGFASVGDANATFFNYTFAGGITFDCDDDFSFSRVPANQRVPIPTLSPLQTVPSDENNIFNSTESYLTRQDLNMTAVNVGFGVTMINVADCNSAENFANIEAKMYRFDVANNSIDWTTYYSWVSQNMNISAAGVVNSTFDQTLSLNAVPLNTSVVIVARARNIKKLDPASSTQVSLGTNQNLPGFGGCYTKMYVSWVGYGTNQYGKIVDIPSCIDDKLTQKSFLKDIIERFNLVVLSDPDNANNLLIEPYNDYLSQGVIKHWTNKLDTSKEIIVKDTTSMQKKSIILGDLEDVDMWNKTIKAEQPTYNPYGKIEILETNNDFAKGEMKNNSIFSPYINERIFRNEDTDLGTIQVNMAIQYEYSYKGSSPNIENPLEATKPKMFYYNGSATSVVGDSGVTNYYLHKQNTDGSVVAIEFGKYPLCTPFELSTSSGVATLTTTTRSLYWNQAPPLCGDLTVFNYNQNSVLSLNSLYYEYWQTYLNTIYNEESRIMECYLNLDSVDIFNFKFNDEIFIKDTYWRILNISNYQVGGQASTKVTLIKAGEIYGGTCNDCNYIPGLYNGQNQIGPFLVFCPSDNAGCTPDFTAPNYSGIYVDVPSCEAAGGTSWTQIQFQAANGLYPCMANTGSLPINLATIFSYKSLFSGDGTKSLIAGKVNGYNVPLIVGNNTDKYSQALTPYYGNDIIVKYNTTPRNIPQIIGESHRIILSGHTIANTKGYAFIQGDENEKKLIIPSDSNTLIRVKGISTVVGGTSATHPVGSTEAFAYYTGFKTDGTTSTQLGTIGGTAEFSIKESGVTGACSLYIDISNGELRFGLQDIETDTKRVWELSVEMDINLVPNIHLPFSTDYALYQNGNNIELQNGNYLLWN